MAQPPPPPKRPSSGAWPSRPEIEQRESGNLILLAIHQIVFRVGWMFKTESVIMPAFLDAVAGQGWLRGFLPVLNRFGQSLPPVFCAQQLHSTRFKKRALALFTVLMAVPFAALSGAWWSIQGERRFWMPAFFLVVYAVFFVFNGLYHLSFGTVQGKLIRPTRRGRLLQISTFWGSIPAMAMALWLMPEWLDHPVPGYVKIFAFVSVCFAASGFIVTALAEPGDNHPPIRHSFGASISETLQTLRSDANLRRLVFLSMIFGSGLIILPHYQAFARERLGLAGRHLMVWVITQSVAVGIYSLFVGPLADRHGNRLTLRTLVFGSAIAPLFAVSLPYFGPDWGARLFWMVFIALGITPLVLRVLVNYTLEICAPEQHPRYLSTVNLCIAAPFLFSPLVGWAVDLAGFEPVFLCTAGLIILSGWMTYTLEEPRHRAEPGEEGPLVVRADE